LKIHYTLHAIERMGQRGISREEVETRLNNPDRIIEDKESKCVKRLNGKVPIVAYRVEAKAITVITVITAYRASKLHKYLRSE